MKFQSLLLGGAVLCVTGLAHAQPDTNNAPKANNPPNVNVGGGGRGGGNRPQLTPEQRQQMVDQMLKRILTQSGFTDATLQDAVVAYAKAQAEATAPLEQKLRQINEALRGDAVTETNLMSLLNSFRASVDDEKIRRTKALADLDAKISFSKKPKLDALLLTLGLTGDESAIVSGGAMGALNRGGGGGGFGGGVGFGGGGPGGGGGQGGGGGGGFGALGGGGGGRGGGRGGQNGGGGQDAAGNPPADAPPPPDAMRPIVPQGGFNF